MEDSLCVRRKNFSSFGFLRVELCVGKNKCAEMCFGLLIAPQQEKRKGKINSIKFAETTASQITKPKTIL